MVRSHGGVIPFVLALLTFFYSCDAMLEKNSSLNQQLESEIAARLTKFSELQSPLQSKVVELDSSLQKIINSIHMADAATRQARKADSCFSVWARVINPRGITFISIGDLDKPEMIVTIRRNELAVLDGLLSMEKGRLSD